MLEALQFCFQSWFHGIITFIFWGMLCDAISKIGRRKKE